MNFGVGLPGLDQLVLNMCTFLWQQLNERFYSKLSGNKTHVCGDNLHIHSVRFYHRALNQVKDRIQKYLRGGLISISPE